MAKLTYWIAERTDDAICYSIIGKTKKAVQAILDSGQYDHATFEPVQKRVIHYQDAFDLFDWATSEAGGRGMGLTD
jgi:hypothetical protein